MELLTTFGPPASARPPENRHKISAAPARFYGLTQRELAKSRPCEKTGGGLSGERRSPCPRSSPRQPRPGKSPAGPQILGTCLASWHIADPTLPYVVEIGVYSCILANGEPLASAGGEDRHAFFLGSPPAKAGGSPKQERASILARHGEPGASAPGDGRAVSHWELPLRCKNKRKHTKRRAAGFSQRRKITQCTYPALPGLQARGSPDKNQLFCSENAPFCAGTRNTYAAWSGGDFCSSRRCHNGRKN